MKGEARQAAIASIWRVDSGILRANHYDANRIFGPEMRLLKFFIFAHGWTKWIVARRDDEIVDGFAVL